jgi:sterol desaturase/sphingolipid hydroxylase (fatty acid hydroxylase superfamily)
MLDYAIAFVAGMFAWTLVEYVIHGVLAHAHRTVVTRLHDVHHRDPRAVFAMRSWIPAALVLALGFARFGLTPAMLFVGGLAGGFVAYELVHYRIHFASPACALEARLRARHLAHHVRKPDAIFGVTTPIWDVVFGTEPAPERMRELLAAGARVAPLQGPSNLGRAIRSRIAAS